MASFSVGEVQMPGACMGTDPEVSSTDLSDVLTH